MPATRSSTRLSAIAVQHRSARLNSTTTLSTNLSNGTGEAEKTQATKTKQTRRKVQVDATAKQTITPAFTSVPNSLQTLTKEPDTIVPAVLTFSLDEAKQHLVSVDRRFEDLFNKMLCKPFENLETFHPFQALATSILGQQISWLAAKSIRHKFIRLYDPSLPEKPDEVTTDSFPSPEQVASTDLAVLRTAGLSTRKAEYIQDLAQRFADGRLSTYKILSANDDELAEMLIAVRGIGRWTVDMFAIFSLRRPNILPVGDLGVQRGIALWFLALHSPSDPFSISPAKVSQGTSEKTVAKNDEDVGSDTEEGYLPTTGNNTQPKSGSNRAVVDEKDPLGGLPPPFTPSIKKTLSKPAGDDFSPLPSSLSVAELKTRLRGKKKVKGALLTPQEMENLTESWKPYRSIGVYYMWSLASSE